VDLEHVALSVHRRLRQRDVEAIGGAVEAHPRVVDAHPLDEELAELLAEGAPPPLREPEGNVGEAVAAGLHDESGDRLDVLEIAVEPRGGLEQDVGLHVLQVERAWRRLPPEGVVRSEHVGPRELAQRQRIIGPHGPHGQRSGLPPVPVVRGPLVRDPGDREVEAGLVRALQVGAAEVDEHAAEIGGGGEQDLAGGMPRPPVGGVEGGDPRGHHRADVQGEGLLLPHPPGGGDDLGHGAVGRDDHRRLQRDRAGEAGEPVDEAMASFRSRIAHRHLAVALPGEPHEHAAGLQRDERALSESEREVRPFQDDIPSDQGRPLARHDVLPGATKADVGIVGKRVGLREDRACKRQCDQDAAERSHRSRR